jgi:hypothetical protein
MTTIELYRKHKAGQVSKNKFLYEVRKDANLPWVTNLTSYDDAVKILKNNRIISEAEIEELSPQTKYNAAMKAVDRSYLSDNPSDIDRKKAVRQGNKFVSEIDPVLKKAVEDFGNNLGFNTKIEKGGTGNKLEPIVQILMGRDLREPQIKVIITKNSDKIEGGNNLPDEAAERRLGTLIKQIQQKELDVELKSDSLNEVDNNVPTDPAVDRVNPYYLKRGVQMLLNKEKELTNDSYIKALNKAALMLQKNPHAFDEEMFANAKDVEKADTKLETQEVKKAKHKDKANEMKKVKVKALKEAAIGELKDYLKKKEQINEDSHWKHNIGSEVHTPDGEGKIVEIVGSTFTVEMEDGTRKDYQINTVDHFTQKAQEELPVQKPQPDQTVKDMWASWKGKPFSGMVGDPEYFKKPLDLSKLKEFIAKHKGDKDKMGKLKEAIKKLKEIKALVVPKSATGMQIDKIAAADPTIKPGQQIDIIRK